MALTKIQKAELKKIEAYCKRIEKLSEKKGFSLNEYIPELDYNFSNLSEVYRSNVSKHIRSRKQVFEQSDTKKQKEYAHTRS